LPTGPANDHFSDGGVSWFSARASRALPANSAPATASAITVETIGAALLPVFTSTSSAIEFGTGRGCSTRLSSGNTIRK
jgi:hypothetical protein